MIGFTEELEFIWHTLINNNGQMIHGQIYIILWLLTLDCRALDSTHPGFWW